MKSEQQTESFAAVPMQVVGPIRIAGLGEAAEDVWVPLATYESPLWPSVGRGAKVSKAAGGIRVTVAGQRMTRSVLLQTRDAGQALRVWEAARGALPDLQAVVAGTSRFARLLDMHAQILGNLVFIRLELSTGDASGHNMVTLAADKVLDWLLERHPEAAYVSISGNYCTDKKPSAVNGILGRGWYVIAELDIPADSCGRLLRCTPAQVVALNIKKNLVGTMLAGAVRSANAHFANVLLAYYLATGQDAANIIEGSQGFTYAEERDGGLYFSVTLPNVIVGTVGSGKEAGFVRENLRLLGCDEPRAPGGNARRLAGICGAAVLCGELSLLAAQTNRGELMRAHKMMERKGHGPSRQ